MEKSKTALIVDDEPSVAEICDRILTGLNFAVTVAGTGTRAKEFAKDNDYDLIMCDIRLPEENGIEFFSWLKTERPDLAERIFFMSGSVMGSETTQFLENCGRPYLLKPFRPSELVDLVRKYVLDKE